MVGNELEILAAFVVYLGIMVTIGFLYYKKTNSVSDYILGGRGLNKFVTALSAEASDMSGWLLIGVPGLAYLSGMSVIWIAIGLIIGTFPNQDSLLRLTVSILIDINEDWLTGKRYLPMAEE